MNNRFTIYLYNLGFSDNDLKEKQGNEFSYYYGSGEPITYVYTESNNDIFTVHQKFWNKNNYSIFIAVSTEKTYVINAKQKPNKDSPLASQVVIKSFDYGVNTEGYDKEEVKKITKEYIDSTYFFNFVIKLTANKRNFEVDKHLLLNLIALRNDLLKINNDDNTIHLLILRSLFIKYLEDKGIYPNDYWTGILEAKSPVKILNAFNEVRKINGDIFDEELSVSKIRVEYIEKLYLFFTSDYRSGQKSLFPYQFDKIPIQLISHVYEAFLKSKEKKGKGIYYTPAFVVNFMLSHTLPEKLAKNNKVTILDPAVGSGAFLVESLKKIFQHNPELSYEQKKNVLENQLYGIDNDSKALQIAAFSLYLTLIETEDSEFIREQIKNAHPILPSLIGNSLICANALIDDVFPDKTFDCIVSNPPWGAVGSTKESQKERAAIHTKGKEGTKPEYRNVADYERSQAFLLRVKKWSNENTILSLIVKNSMFLNDNSKAFRKELLKTYQINNFYELSNYNKVLFKKKTYGKKPQQIELGASEPSVILIFELPKNEKHVMRYIAPKLNGFSENFQLIHYTQKDINEVEQTKFIEDDLLWRVLVNGDFETYNLIKEVKNKFEGETIVESGRGFEPKKEEKLLGGPEHKNWLDIDCFSRYKIFSVKSYNWNQEFRNKRDNIFESQSIIFPRRPLMKDNFKLRAVIAKRGSVFKDNIVFLKIIEDNKYIQNYMPYLGIINSSFYGFVLFIISIQWNKGEEKRASIRISDINNIPIPNSSYPILNKINNYVTSIYSSTETNYNIENKIDELVFDLYNLKEYQKEIIREFYQIRVERAGNRLKYVYRKDIVTYIEEFAKSFNLMLEKGKKLVGKYNISANVGAVVGFTIVDENDEYSPKEDKTLEILHFVKKKQITQAERDKILNEDKVKIYDNEFMYIIKSNLFKDWTVRQAMRDAKEEIGLIVSNLPDQ